MVQSPEAAQQASVEAFKKLGICEQLAEAAAALGWKEPTSIQQQAVPLLLQGDFCLLKPTILSACRWQHEHAALLMLFAHEFNAHWHASPVAEHAVACTLETICRCTHVSGCIYSFRVVSSSTNLPHIGIDACTQSRVWLAHVNIMAGPISSSRQMQQQHSVLDVAASRTGCHWTGADWVRQDRRICASNLAGESMLLNFFAMTWLVCCSVP